MCVRMIVYVYARIYVYMYINICTQMYIIFIDVHTNIKLMQYIRQLVAYECKYM